MGFQLCIDKTYRDVKESSGGSKSSSRWQWSEEPGDMTENHATAGDIRATRFEKSSKSNIEVKDTIGRSKSYVFSRNIVQLETFYYF